MAPNGPRDAVFTTVLLNESGAVADWTLHQQRLERHAQRLRIHLPDTAPTLSGLPEGKGWRLARISCTSTHAEWVVEVRRLAFRDEAIEAITCPAPRWNDRTNGCKHGDWGPYLQAQQAAERAGCDAALLIHDHAIVDGDRATPLVLDEDGTVWMASETEGGVDGITAAVLLRALPEHGFPVVRGKLNERTVARCEELVLVGTGIGVCRVNTLDGEPLGKSTALSEQCQRLLHQHFTEAGTWTDLGMGHV
jgi:branched-subunit amino acid aminotransferase/4-amino-4-deoxychorismate lyase